MHELAEAVHYLADCLFLALCARAVVELLKA